MHVSEELRNGPLFRALGPLLGAAKSILPAIPYLGAGQEILGALIDFAMVTDPLGTVAGLRGRLVPATKIARAIVSRTPSPADDEIVTQCEALLQNDALLAFVASVINRFQTENPAATPAGLLAFVDANRENLAEAAAEQQLDMATIIQAIQLILKIIAMVTGSTGGVTPAATTAAPTATPGNPWGF